MKLGSTWVRWVSLWLPSGERARWREEWLSDLDALQRAGAPIGDRMGWAAGVWFAAVRFRTDGASMDGWGREFRNAIRSLLRRPAFAAIAVITLGLGIGASTAIFSVVNGVVLEPLPYPESEELVNVTTAFPTMDFHEFWMSPPEYLELQERSRELESVGGFRAVERSVGGGDQPERVVAAIATWSLFPTLGVDPMIGRVWTPEEDLPGAAPVALLSWEMWSRTFGRDPGIVGRSIEVNGTTTTVLGVMPRGFDLDDNGIQLWVPSGIDMTAFGRASHWLEVVGRLRPGATPASLNRELEGLVARWEEDSGSPGHAPDPEFHPLAAESLQENVVGEVRAALLVLLGAVGFVLMIACANVANLLLARAEDRQKEVSVRVALGAGRGRLIRQFLTEGVVLATAGALLGVGLAAGALQLLRIGAPGDLPRVAEIDLDGTVLLVTTGITVLVGVFFGLAPARHISLGSLGTAIREGGARTTANAARRGLRSLLVVSEMALALILVVGAGLLLRSFGSLTAVEPGFDPENALTFSLYLPATSYAEDTELRDFYTQLEASLEARPEFSEVALTSELPPAQTLSANDLDFESLERIQDGPAHNVDYVSVVSHDYVETMGLRLLEGREFLPSDDVGGVPVAVVNRTFAETFFPGESPIGQRVRQCCGEGPYFEIVGVLEDVRQNGLDQPAGTELFLSMGQVAERSMYVVARTTGDPAAAADAARRTVWERNATLPVSELAPMTAVIGDSLARSRFLAVLMSAFAVIALLLAAVGTYGVMSYSVAQRSRELGIRMAMGAEAGRVQRLVLGQGLVVAAIGLALGVAGAWALTGLLESLLFGVAARDPASFLIGPVVLALVATLACWLPARRATRLDPVTVLREE